MNKIFFSTMLALFLGTFGVAYGQQDQHIRFAQGRTQTDGALQIAVTEMISPVDSNVRVTLYGVVHIADKAYYDQVQRDLATFDTVLYEGVKADEKPNQSTVLLNLMQKLFGEVLGLTFQKDGINYHQSNYVHADISIGDLRQKMGDQPLTPLDGAISPEQLEKMKPLLDTGITLVKHLMDARPEMRNSLKMQFGTQLGTADISKQLNPQMYQAIVIDRNQIVMDVLKRELKQNPNKKKIAIFYGAGHNPDFVQRFEQMGWKQGSKRWMSAWTIGSGPVAAPAPQRRQPAEVR